VLNFILGITATYLYAIFLLSLRAKISHKAIRPAKLLLIALMVGSLILLIVEFQTGWALFTQIIVFLPLPYMLFMIYINEIKAIYKRIGVARRRGYKHTKTDNDLADKLLEAVEFLATRKIGALITVERNINLSAFISKAMMINAPVSSELLVSIFIPTTPLHDGAVIIRDNSILCAKAYYPSTERTDLPLHFGTRNPAAIGISEQSDALTIVVSEETGYMSITINRQIDYNISKETLNLYFEKYLKIK
jgi:diadenylate cyclase